MKPEGERKKKADIASTNVRKRIPKDKFAKILNLAGHEKDPKHEDMLKSLSKHLEGFKINGSFAINIDNKERWLISMIEGKVNFEKNIEGKSEFEIEIDKKTALRIANGSISPIIALGREKMRIKGNTDFAIEVYQKLAAGDGIIDPCRRR